MAPFCYSPVLLDHRLGFRDVARCLTWVVTASEEARRTGWCQAMPINWTSLAAKRLQHSGEIAHCVSQLQQLTVHKLGPSPKSKRHP